jgi:hypothetical protein
MGFISSHDPTPVRPPLKVKTQRETNFEIWEKDLERRAAVYDKKKPQKLLQAPSP